MSFDKFPIVDRYSENEDESNAYFRLNFSQRNGFLVSKPEDKGCDFVIELIRANTSTNWRFPVQVKSIEEPSFIENGSFISYSFSVSRLRYMLETVPPVGLIVLYWPKSNTLYYDYAESLYARLLEKRDGNMSWKSNEEVNLHFPAVQIIDNSSITEIHKQILLRFQNSSDRSQLLHPDASNLTVVDKTEKLPIPDATAEEILLNEGFELYYDHEIPRLSLLIDLIPVKTLRENARLSLLAGITFMKLGMLVDASFFIEKAIRNSSVTEEDLNHAMWVKNYLDRQLGKISNLAYKEIVEKKLADIPLSDIGNRLRYELCIHGNEIEMLSTFNMRSIFDFSYKFVTFNIRIHNANLPLVANIPLYLENATAHGLLTVKADYFFRIKTRLDRKNGTTIDNELMEGFKEFVHQMGIDVEYVFPRLKPPARNFANNILLAYCLESQVLFRLLMDHNALRLPIEKFDFQSATFIEKLKDSVLLGVEALEIFLQHNFYANAYNVALMLMELSEFAQYAQVNIDLDMGDLQQKVAFIQQKSDYAKPAIRTLMLIEEHNKHFSIQ